MKKQVLLSKGWNYLTGTIYNGRVIPIGWSKNLEYARTIAKLHKCRIYKLTELEDYTDGLTTNS